MASGNVLVLGIGNILWADEGFGVRVVQALQQAYEFPPQVTLMDGGTQGLGLVPYVQAAETLIIIDAVDFQQAPGTLLELRDAEVPAYLGANKMSLHQVSFQEVLALSQLLGDGPSRLFLVGVQPDILEDYGGSLSALIKAQIEPAMRSVLAYLAELGVTPQPSLGDAEASPNITGIEAYEQYRPSADAACRIGDARFF